MAKYWKVPLSKVIPAMERFVDELDMPVELYEPFCLGLMRTMMVVRNTPMKRKKRKGKGNIIPFERQ